MVPNILFLIAAALATVANGSPPMDRPDRTVPNKSLPPGAITNDSNAYIPPPALEPLPPLQGLRVATDPADAHAEDNEMDKISRSVPKGSKGWEVIEDNHTKLSRSRIHQMQKNMKLDPKNPPEHSSPKFWSYACAEYLLYCTINVGFFKKRIMAEVTNVTVFIDSFIDAQDSSPPEAEVTLKSTKSTSVARAKTEGWKVGVKASLSTAANGNTPLIEASAEYSNIQTNTRTVTITNERSITCPKGRRCSFQTWLFNARVQGKCRQRQWIDCSGETDMCGRFPIRSWFAYRDWNGCSTFKNWHWGGCLNPRLPEFVDCEFEVPILNSAGAYYVEQHTIIERRISA
ncbi:hypothetical protein LOZ55_000474 [Ophidiomyces ophidiicola]|nr:hypothetical protein LOZ55_000474 [Ophidiomyces ophidiicola]